MLVLKIHMLLNRS